MFTAETGIRTGVTSVTSRQWWQTRSISISWTLDAILWADPRWYFLYLELITLKNMKEKWSRRYKKREPGITWTWTKVGTFYAAKICQIITRPLRCARHNPVYYTLLLLNSCSSLSHSRFVDNFGPACDGLFQFWVREGCNIYRVIRSCRAQRRRLLTRHSNLVSCARPSY